MFGLDDAIGAGLGVLGKIIDRVVPDPAQAQAAQLELLKLAQTGELAALTAETSLTQGQLDINKVEAASSSVFVAGWRPFIGWICGVGLSIQFVVAPFATWAVALLHRPDVVFPVLNGDVLMALVSGLLGLGGLRTFDKLKGTASIGMGPKRKKSP